MIIEFDYEQVLDLAIEVNETNKVWSNIHKDDMLQKEISAFFANVDDDDSTLNDSINAIRFTKKGYIHPDFISKDAIGEEFYLLRRDEEVFLINNAVGSNLKVYAKNINLDELNKIKDKDFAIKFDPKILHCTDLKNEEEKFKIILDEKGISVEIQLNDFEFADDKLSYIDF